MAGGWCHHPTGERKWCGWISPVIPNPRISILAGLLVAMFTHKDAVELKAPHKFRERHHLPRSEQVNPSAQVLK